MSQMRFDDFLPITGDPSLGRLLQPLWQTPTAIAGSEGPRKASTIGSTDRSNCRAGPRLTGARRRKPGQPHSREEQRRQQRRSTCVSLGRM